MRVVIRSTTLLSETVQRKGESFWMDLMIPKPIELESLKMIIKK